MKGMESLQCEILNSKKSECSKNTNFICISLMNTECRKNSLSMDRIRIFLRKVLHTEMQVSWTGTKYDLSAHSSSNKTHR